MSSSAGDRDRLAADLHEIACGASARAELDLCVRDHRHEADRLIALGWMPLDEERLARALDKITDVGIYPDNNRSSYQDGWNAACIAIAERLDDLVAIAKAYREDTDATD